MKTEIRYSWIYNRKFDSKFTKGDLFKLKKDCIKFEALYEKYIDKIIKLIEKYHRKKWGYNFTPIYIVKNIPVSFSDPLTLRYLNNEKSMLVVLAHELLHNNFVGKWDFKNSKELHGYMKPILNKVILDLPIDLKKELDLFNKRTMEGYK